MGEASETGLGVQVHLEKVSAEPRLLPASDSRPSVQHLSTIQSRGRKPPEWVTSILNNLHARLEMVGGINQVVSLGRPESETGSTAWKEAREEETEPWPSPAVLSGATKLAQNQLAIGETDGR